MENNPNPIILFSGGIDSLALVVMAINSGKKPLLYHIIYNHPASKYEMKSALRIHEAIDGLCDIRLQEINIMSSELFAGVGKRGSRFVRGRNLIFISSSLNISLLGNYDEIWIGSNKNDYDNYWDCRPEFIESLNRMIQDPIKVRAPLINMTKNEIIKSIPDSLRSLAWSCYEPKGDRPCGKCDSCEQKND